MSCYDQGNIKVYGAVGRRKHEKKAGDYQGSITMYRSGTPVVHNVPTAFIMKGKRRRKGITEKYLLDKGCAVGSTVAINMTTRRSEERRVVMLGRNMTTRSSDLRVVMLVTMFNVIADTIPDM